MTSAQLRQSFLDFFREKQHAIVPSGSLLPSSPNLLFTNAGMNQFVPYFLGTENCPYTPGRAADTQKCIRAGGKHNDLDDVGLDTYHHTFFEMLGNWSFGDYFKKEAIAWAWELVVGRWGFPPARLYATVYAPASGDPASFDQEAHDIWAEKFIAAGLDPKIHIVNGNKKDNFWMMGETGPCGPCSELHVDLTPAGDTAGKLVNAGSPLCMEIWNLVFIQFNANADGTFSPLPAQHVDTGMGFERVAAIMQCSDRFADFGKRVSNYDTDVFRPLFDHLAALSGHVYTGSLPGDPGVEPARLATDIAFRVIADHIRTLSFSIADGISPGNTGRNHVLRRILRRALRFARTIGLAGNDQPPLLPKLAETVAACFGEVFPELSANLENIKDTLAEEEKSFKRTLDKGIALFEAHVAGLQPDEAISGEFAFRLYDEQGFPLDLTELMARERGLAVDQEKFEKLMDGQRALARAARTTEIIVAEDNLSGETTEFRGYGADAVETELLALSSREGVQFAITAATPFYAEMGGQVGDTGFLQLGDLQVAVTNTVKKGGVFFHKLAEPLPSDTPPATPVTLQLDRPRRRNIEANHTATHLLHWALHQHVGPEATQKGSLVAPDRLRFDFNSKALTPEQLHAIEASVNQAIFDNHPILWRQLPYAEVKGNSAITQMFGEKYGETVRVVQIGGSEDHLDGFSMELCAGTHATSTGTIGMFKIISEGAVAAGIRRIEAVAGHSGVQWLLRHLSEEKAENSRLKAELLEAQKTLEKERATARQKEAVALVRELAAGASGTCVARHLPAGSGPLLDALLAAWKSAGREETLVVATEDEGRALLAASVPVARQKALPAGKLIQELSAIVGGKGGGRPESARGAGPDTSKIAEALRRAVELAG